MARKPTFPLSARVSDQTDKLRDELQERLDIPLHDLIDLGFRALKSQLEAKHPVSELVPEIRDRIGAPDWHY